jgi:hypothetical protein
MPTKKYRSEKQRNIKKQKCTTIIEEGERFEDLGPRMHELLLTHPKEREFIFAFETT